MDLNEEQRAQGFKVLTKCRGCPCLNNDYESGYECNLGFNTDLYWTPEADLVPASPNCKLVSIDTEQDVIQPSQVIARRERVLKPGEVDRVKTETEKMIEAQANRFWTGVLSDRLKDLQKPNPWVKMMNSELTSPPPQARERSE